MDLPLFFLDARFSPMYNNVLFEMKKARLREMSEEAEREGRRGEPRVAVLGAGITGLSAAKRNGFRTPN